MKALRLALWKNVFTDTCRCMNATCEPHGDFSTLAIGETEPQGAATASVGRVHCLRRQAAVLRGKLHAVVHFHDLSQFPESLIESELFVTRRGLHGPIDAHDGVLARCSPHGAIFLDEIGDAAIPVQIKLLQVLRSACSRPWAATRRSGSTAA